MAEWKANPHGGGVAYLERKKEKNPDGYTYSRELKIEKGIMRKDLFRKCLKANLGRTVIAHVRYATHGNAEEENTHPFWTCGGTVAMCHNGILPSPWSSSTEISDSRLMANTLSMLSFYDIVRDSKEIGNQIGWNKLVFLSKDGYLHIINDRMGEWLSRGSVWISQRLTNFSRTYGAPRRHYDSAQDLDDWNHDGYPVPGIHEISDEQYQRGITED